MQEFLIAGQSVTDSTQPLSNCTIANHLYIHIAGLFAVNQQK